MFFLPHISGLDKSVSSPGIVSNIIGIHFKLENIEEKEPIFVINVLAYNK